MSFQNVAGTALNGGQAATNAAFDSAKGALGALPSAGRWTEINICNQSEAGTLEISSVNTSRGHMYPEGDRWKSIEDKVFVGAVIKPGNSYIHRAAAKEDSPTGTEGSFTVKDKATGKDQCEVYFRVPWASTEENEVSIRRLSETWFFKQKGGAGPKGNLGNVTIVADHLE